MLERVESRVRVASSRFHASGVGGGDGGGDARRDAVAARMTLLGGAEDAEHPVHDGGEFMREVRAAGVGVLAVRPAPRLAIRLEGVHVGVAKLKRRHRRRRSAGDSRDRRGTRTIRLAGSHEFHQRARRGKRANASEIGRRRRLRRGHVEMPVDAANRRARPAVAAAAARRRRAKRLIDVAQSTAHERRGRRRAANQT